MDFHSDHQKYQTCSKHNQPIVLFNQDGPCCVACLQQLPDNISIEKNNQQQKEIYDKVIKQIDLDYQSFQDLYDKLLQFRNVIIQSLDKISQLILDQLKTIKEQKYKMEYQIKSNMNQQSMIDDLQLASNNQQQFNKDAKDQIRKLFQEIDKFYTFLEDKQIDVKKCKIQIQEVQIENVQQSKQFQYELIKDLTVEQNNICFSFAFNKNNTILVIGVREEIIVCEFMNGRILNQLQRLHDHTDDVYCLYFMKQTNTFVSGCQDNSIIIWTLDNNNKWIAQQVLKEHSGFVICILMNKIEDQLISGSRDCTLKFWRKKTGSWTCSQSISTKYQVWNVSLNEMEDKLIICENNYELLQTTKKMSFIQVLMFQNNQKWSIVQTIDIPEHGWRLSFTIGDQFVFATDNSDYLQVYDYDTGKRQFEIVSQIKIQNVKDCSSLFPCQFIKQLNILTYKHGKFINIIKVNDKNNYELMQFIEYGDKYTYGKVTDDGQYLMTWDNGSKKTRKITLQR